MRKIQLQEKQIGSGCANRTDCKIGTRIGKFTFAVYLMLGVALVTMTHPAYAQGRNAGELRGTVVDSSGAAVPGTEVTAKEISTGISVKSVTDNSGFYDMPYVEAGHYSVSFNRKGFKTFVQSDVELHVNTVTVNATLGVGEVTEQVTVNTVPPLLDTESPQLNTVLSSTDVAELPCSAPVAAAAAGNTC